ncbi:hypothetical protein G6F56_010220 [Rhizopus delemar]|nr:hypothetical protein G6F56_010220 [Rhizopus delemar]
MGITTVPMTITVEEMIENVELTVVEIVLMTDRAITDVEEAVTDEIVPHVIDETITVDAEGASVPLHHHAV